MLSMPAAGVRGALAHVSCAACARACLCRERDALEQNCLEARAELAAMQVSLQQVSERGPAAGGAHRPAWAGPC